MSTNTFGVALASNKSKSSGSISGIGPLQERPARFCARLEDGGPPQPNKWDELWKHPIIDGMIAAVSDLTNVVNDGQPTPNLESQVERSIGISWIGRMHRWDHWIKSSQPGNVASPAVVAAGFSSMCH